MPADVFISYSRKDLEFILKLSQSLENHGITTWIDQGAIIAGDAWRRQIVDGIEACKIFLIVLSPNSAASENVTKELSIAESSRKKILPVLYQPVEIPRTMAYQLAGVQYQSFDRGNYESNFTRLLQAIANLGVQIHEETVKQIPFAKEQAEVERLAPGKAEQERLTHERTQIKPLPQAVPGKKSANKSLMIIGLLALIGLCIVGGGILIATIIIPGLANPSSQVISQPTTLMPTAVVIATAAPSAIAAPTRAPVATLAPPAPTAAPTTTTAPPRPTSTAAPKVSPIDGADMVYVPTGEFLMGNNNYDDQKPVHTVYVDAFWIDKFKVTNGLYKKCVDQRACNPPSENKSNTRNSYYGNAQFDNYPVIYVSWTSALSYCAWAKKRLPTEAEWEKAARGSDARIYPWGNIFDKNLLNSLEGGKNDTTPVSNYPNGASPYGVLDIAGNVWEWAADWYNSNYYATTPRNNPKGPSSGTIRVIRGGAWSRDETLARTSFRSGDYPGTQVNALGFRCAE